MRLAAPQTFFTQAYLQQLEEAMASGASTVSYEGKSISYRSLAEMKETASMIRSALGLSTKKSRTVLSAHDRGFK